MDLYDVMHTTFAARQFTDEPVPDATLHRILDHARFAPSGGNRQGWRVIVVREQAMRERFGQLIEPTMKRYIAQVMAGESPYNTVNASSVDDAAIEQAQVPPGLLQVVHAPALLVVCVDLSVVASFDRELDRVGVISGASVYPFVWNILLAARNEGLGGTLTTFLAESEPEVKRLLELPDGFAVCALLPLGHPVKQLTKLSRKPVEEFARIGSWNGAPLGS